MLTQLTIRNIALIESLTIELGAGLNVLTGETGAGKSIVVDALGLVLGGRADRQLVRAGAGKASVEALFDIARNEAVQALLTEWSLTADDDLLPVSRELSETGRGLCRVCGVVLPLARLQTLTALLVDLHGQHEHQLLLSPSVHLRYLDAFGDDAHRALVAQARTLYDAYAASLRALRERAMDEAERERLRDMLVFQLGEIDEVKPKAGEDDALSRRNALLANAERVSAGLSRALDALYRGTSRSPSAFAGIKKASDALDDLSGLDERFRALAERVESLYYNAEDAGLELASLAESLDFDPAEADRVAARLSDLRKLERKYGPTLADVLAFRRNAQARLDELSGGEAEAEALQKTVAERKAALAICAQRLSQSRRALAKTYTSRLLAEFSALGLSRARFEVRFEPLPECSENGAEKVEFLLSANPGQPLRPLAAVASGGELSRIMLAMKTIEADNAGVDAMVFDEIDTGVSGRMAQIVGEKMARIARSRQVICVTHLPQIAALGDRHYLVEKTFSGDTTGSAVRLLDDAGRVDELARMIGSAEHQESARVHAQSLLAAGRREAP